MNHNVPHSSYLINVCDYFIVELEYWDSVACSLALYKTSLCFY